MSSSATLSRIAKARQLFVSFFRVGLFTFGGGYAMLPLLEREAIDRRGWATHAEILDLYGLAQVAPGVISVNTATFLGQRQAGYLGALAATAGMLAPSVLVILAVASVLGRFQEQPLVVAAFAGIRAGVGGLLVATAWRIVRNTCRNAAETVLMLAAVAVAMLLPGGAGWAILAALGAGMARLSLHRRRSSARKDETHGRGVDA